MKPVVGLQSQQRSRLVAALGVCLIALSWLLLASPAAGHSRLLSADPASGANLASLPSTVTLEFSGDLGTTAYVAVTGPNGTALTQGEVEIAGSVVSQDLAGDGSPGNYSVAYKVFSDDGHPIAGQYFFTVGAAADAVSPAAAPSASAEVATPAEAEAPSVTASPSRLEGRGLDIGVAGALFGGAAVLWLASLRTSSQSNEHDTHPEE